MTKMMIDQLKRITTIPMAAYVNVSFACLTRWALPAEVSIKIPPQMNMNVANTAMIPKMYFITCVIRHWAVSHLIGLGIDTAKPDDEDEAEDVVEPLGAGGPMGVQTGDEPAVTVKSVATLDVFVVEVMGVEVVEPLGVTIDETLYVPAVQNGPSVPEASPLELVVTAPIGTGTEPAPGGVYWNTTEAPTSGLPDESFA